MHITRTATARQSVQASTMDIKAHLALLEDNSKLVEQSPAEQLSLQSKGMTAAHFTRADSRVQSFIDSIF